MRTYPRGFPQTAAGGRDGGRRSIRAVSAALCAISVDASRERCFVSLRATIDFERRYVGVGRGYA